MRAENRVLRKMLERRAASAVRKMTKPPRECRACRYRREGIPGGPKHTNCPRARN